MRIGVKSWEMSKQSQSRLRLQVAQRLAGCAVPTKKPRIQPTASTDHREDETYDVPESNDQAHRELEVAADSSSEDCESYTSGKSLGVTTVNNPSESLA